MLNKFEYPTIEDVQKIIQYEMEESRTNGTAPDKTFIKRIVNELIISSFVVNELIDIDELAEITEEMLDLLNMASAELLGSVLEKRYS